MFNQGEFLKLKVRKFFHFQATFENLSVICLTYWFEFFAIPILHIICCKSEEVTKVSKPVRNINFPKNEKKLKKSGVEKTLDLKNKNKIKFSSALNLIQTLLPL